MMIRPAPFECGLPNTEIASCIRLDELQPGARTSSFGTQSSCAVALHRISGAGCSSLGCPIGQPIAQVICRIDFTG